MHAKESLLEKRSYGSLSSPVSVASPFASVFAFFNSKIGSVVKVEKAKNALDIAIDKFFVLAEARENASAASESEMRKIPGRFAERVIKEVMVEYILATGKKDIDKAFCQDAIDLILAGGVAKKYAGKPLSSFFVSPEDYLNGWKGYISSDIVLTMVKEDIGFAVVSSNLGASI